MAMIMKEVPFEHCRDRLYATENMRGIRHVGRRALPLASAANEPIHYCWGDRAEDESQKETK